MSAFEVYLYSLDSVTSYTGPGSLFPNSSLGNTSVAGTVTFGDLTGEKIIVHDNDPDFNDGDTGVLGIGGQTSESSGSLFNLTGSSETEYSYTLTDPGTGDTIRIYAFTSSDLLGLSNNVVGFVADGVIDPNVTYSIAYDQGTPSVPYSSLVICFAAGTCIATGPEAVARVEDLRIGDRVLTADHGLCPIRWIGARHLSQTALAASPSVRPIRIRAGALGRELPETDLIVSPQHRVLVRSGIAQTLFGAQEVMVAAKHLTTINGIARVDDLTPVSYFHLLLDAHDVIFANGAETESLFAGPQTLKTLSAAARIQIDALGMDLTEPPPSCRLQISGHQGRALALRHRKTNTPLVSCGRIYRGVTGQGDVRQPSA